LGLVLNKQKHDATSENAQTQDPSDLKKIIHYNRDFDKKKVLQSDKRTSEKDFQHLKKCIQ
jgi:hypothetical protein